MSDSVIIAALTNHPTAPMSVIRTGIILTSLLTLLACGSAPKPVAQPAPVSKPAPVQPKPYQAWHPDSRRFDAGRYHLYYGQRAGVLKAMGQQLKKHDLAIIDGRRVSQSALRKLFTEARQKQARVIGYLSIGELDSRERERFDQFVQALPPAQHLPFDELALEWNDKFQSWRVDVSHPLWLLWMEHELKRLYQQDFHGVFLDTADTVDRYITYPQWSLAKRTEKVQAMLDLIRRIKSQNPKQFVLLNRGLNLIGEQVWLNEDGSDWVPGLSLMLPHADNPDAVLYENAFASDDPWSQRMEADLLATHQRGHTQVLALGYRDVLNDRSQFVARCRETGFICAWAESSTTLHQSPTTQP